MFYVHIRSCFASLEKETKYQRTLMCQCCRRLLETRPEVNAQCTSGTNSFATDETALKATLILVPSGRKYERKTRTNNATYVKQSSGHLERAFTIGK